MRHTYLHIVSRYTVAKYRGYKKCKLIKKYSNKLSMKALVGKSMLMKQQEKEGNKSQHSLFFTFISLKLKGTQGHSDELKGTHLNPKNSREFMGTQGNKSELI